MGLEFGGSPGALGCVSITGIEHLAVVNRHRSPNPTKRNSCEPILLRDLERKIGRIHGPSLEKMHQFVGDLLSLLGGLHWRHTWAARVKSRIMFRS